MCNKARRFQAPVTGGASEEQLLNTRKLIEREDGSIVEGTCLLGELTDIGRKVRFFLSSSPHLNMSSQRTTTELL